jgi:hypothetical protein
VKSEAASRFLDQLINNPQLRSQFRADPEGTMVSAGIDERDRKELAEMNLADVPDQELAQRVSKRGGVPGFGPPQ